MEGSVVSRVCRAVRRCCWSTTRRRRGYQRIPPVTSSKRPAWRGIRLGRRRPALGSTAWGRSERQTRRRASREQWSSPPLHLLARLVDSCINSVLLRPLKAAMRGFSMASEEGGASSSSPPPKVLRHDDSSSRPPRRGELGGGRGVMLNISVAEVLLRRRSSQVRSSPLQVARKGRPRAGALASGAPVVDLTR